MKTGLSVTTAPGEEPVTLDELKAHLRVTDTAEDDYITSLGIAARVHIEDITNRVALTTTFNYTLPSFPCDTRMIELPISALQDDSVVVTYCDENGDLQTLPADQYYVIADSDPGFIFLKDAYSWPVLESGHPRPVAIEFSAGWADTAAELEDRHTIFKQAVMFLVNHWFELRTPVNVGNLISNIPTTLETVIQNFRVYTLS